MPDGLTLGAFVVLVGLLYVWAAQNRWDSQHDRIEREHQQRRHAIDIIDRCEELNYREALRFDVGLCEILRDAA